MTRTWKRTMVVTSLIPGYYDIALRDFGLPLGALTLARLSTSDMVINQGAGVVADEGSQGLADADEHVYVSQMGASR